MAPFNDSRPLSDTHRDAGQIPFKSESNVLLFIVMTITDIYCPCWLLDRNLDRSLFILKLFFLFVSGTFFIGIIATEWSQNRPKVMQMSVDQIKPKAPFVGGEV